MVTTAMVALSWQASWHSGPTHGSVVAGNRVVDGPGAHDLPRPYRLLPVRDLGADRPKRHSRIGRCRPDRSRWWRAREVSPCAHGPQFKGTSPGRNGVNRAG